MWKTDFPKAILRIPDNEKVKCLWRSAKWIRRRALQHKSGIPLLKRFTMYSLFKKRSIRNTQIKGETDFVKEATADRNNRRQKTTPTEVAKWKTAVKSSEEQSDDGFAVIYRCQWWSTANSAWAGNAIRTKRFRLEEETAEVTEVWQKSADRGKSQRHRKNLNQKIRQKIQIKKKLSSKGLFRRFYLKKNRFTKALAERSRKPMIRKQGFDLEIVLTGPQETRILICLRFRKKGKA